MAVTYINFIKVNGLCQVTSSPRLYVLFRTAVTGIKPVTRLPFVGLWVDWWCGASHLTVCLI